VSIAGQAVNPASVLCRFLDARLPGRAAVAGHWADRAGLAPWSGMAVDADRQRLGVAAEKRIGLDLAAAPGYWDLLSFLPPGDCAALLRGAGFRPSAGEHLADTGTVDPLLLGWVRSSHPVASGDDQRAVLAACWDAALMHGLARDLREHAVQLRRSFFAHQRDALAGSDRSADRAEAAIRGLGHVWEGYLEHGRRPLTALGERVVLAPELAGGFGIADLVVGRCLVEVKTVLEPTQWFGRWLDQLLGYVLLDWFDTLRIDTVGVYLGWQAALITTPLAEVLAVSHAGLPPRLQSLRADFRQEIQPDLDLMLEVQLRDRYPPPITPAPGA
jgi:hypothetical protein